MLLFTLPVCAGCFVLIIAMPLTGTLLSFVMFIGLFILPFTAKRGECPACNAPRLFPFSGIGGHCKNCGEEIVLRGSEVHQIEPKQQTPRPPGAST